MSYHKSAKNLVPKRILNKDEMLKPRFGWKRVKTLGEGPENVWFLCFSFFYVSLEMIALIYRNATTQPSWDLWPFVFTTSNWSQVIRGAHRVVVQFASLASWVQDRWVGSCNPDVWRKKATTKRYVHKHQPNSSIFKTSGGVLSEVGSQKQHHKTFKPNLRQNKSCFVRTIMEIILQSCPWNPRWRIRETPRRSCETNKAVVPWDQFSGRKRGFILSEGWEMWGLFYEGLFYELRCCDIAGFCLHLWLKMLMIKKNTVPEL